jgi:dolichol-phosphate mannosyltransferase
MRNWKTILLRWVKFNAVGATGVLVQTLTLGLLLKVSGLHYLASTALAVEASVLNNFVWHRKWTWADRPRSNAAITLLRFNLTVGAMSLAGNLALMWLFVSAAGLGAMRANLIAILICSVINFMLNDRLVFV